MTFIQIFLIEQSLYHLKIYHISKIRELSYMISYYLVLSYLIIMLVLYTSPLLGLLKAFPGPRIIMVQSTLKIHGIILYFQADLY